MDNDKIKNLCISLATADKENEVIDILKKSNYWDNLDYWRNYGDEENNWSVAGNQQGRPETALVEKLINSVDSVLISECKKANISPDSSDAPKTINKAVEKFFNIHNGKLTNLTPTERTKLANNIGLFSTGERGKDGKVCYTIYDFGEGQTPKAFPDTFLSIGKSNKLKIPFVQGKFNMGGTGVLRFCGKQNLQLIISKKNPALIKTITNDESTQKWGFTIVRRVPPTGNFRSSRYVYLAPQGEVLSFDAESLPILPGNYPEPYKNEMSFGSYIKLYDYQMIGLKTNLILDLYNRLSLLMPSLALPIRLYERRKGFKGHTFETTLNGLSVRLEEDKRNNLESDEWPTTHDITVMGEPMKVSVYAFKRNLEDNKKPTDKYIKDEGIIFTINGQTHGHIHKRFFSRKAVGLGNLADSLIVTVNCSEVSGATREDLFMNSRDRLIESGELRTQIEQELVDILKQHQGLKLLKYKRHEEDIENRLDDSKPLSEVLEKLMKKSPILSRLFISGLKIPNPINLSSKQEKKEFIGKKFPSYFELEKAYPVQAPKEVPINHRKFRVQFKTDAVNDYFERETDKGVHSLLIDGIPFAFNKSMNLWNGHATLNIELPDYLNIGETVTFESITNDINCINPFSETFSIKVVDAVKTNGNGKNKRKNPPTDDEGQDSKDNSSLALPEIIRVKSSEWDSHDFNKESALKVQYNGDDLGWTFFVNIDNLYLLSELKDGKNDNKLVEAQYVYSLVLLGLSIINKFENEEQEQKLEIGVEEMIKFISSSISPVLVPMIKSLGELEEDSILEESMVV